VKSRFAEAEAHRSPSTPRSSRFREEFEPGKSDTKPVPPLPVTPATSTPTPRRRSTKATLTRLAKLAVRSYDGPMEKMLGVPISTPGMREQSFSRGAASPLNDESTLGAWGEAVKHVKDRNTSGSINRKKSNWGRASEKGKQKEEDDTLEESTPYDKLMAEKEFVVDDWEMEMERTAQKAKAKSKKISQKLPTGPDLRFPASWARFPSHDRGERVLNIVSDLIESKDFAIHETTSDGKPVYYQNEMKYHINHYPGDDHESHRYERKKGFFRKLEDKFKDQLPKFDEKDKELVVDQTYGRRGSTNLGAELEYPELEILPVEMMSAAEIEAHVQEALEQEEADKRREEARKKREEEEAELQRKADELDEIFGRKRKKAPESAIQKARVAAEVAKSKTVQKDKAKSPTQKSKRSSKLISMTGEPSSITSEPSASPSSKAAAMTGEVPEVIVTASAVEEEERLDSAGMNTSVMDQQIAARVELKRKMEARRKAGGGRRGPVARKKQPEQVADPVIERTTSPASGIDGSHHFSEDETMVNSVVTSSQVSISDPRYYADCIAARIFTPSPPPCDDAGSECSSWDGRKWSVSNQLEKGMKFGTWSGNNRYQFGDGVRKKGMRMVKSCATLEERKSTEAFRRAIERDQESARIMAINAAKAAWGSSDS
jgi:hypothetical protein